MTLNVRYQLTEPFLTRMRVNLRGGDAFMAQQGLDVHPFSPGVEPVGGVSRVSSRFRSILP